MVSTPLVQATAVTRLHEIPSVSGSLLRVRLLPRILGLRAFEDVPHLGILGNAFPDSVRDDRL